MAIDCCSAHASRVFPQVCLDDPRIRADLVWSTLREHHTEVEDDDAVTEPQYRFNVVLDNKEAYTALTDLLTEADGATNFVIRQATQRFVEHQQPRASAQGDSDAQQPLLTMRERGAGFVGARRQADRLESSHCQAPRFAPLPRIPRPAEQRWQEPGLVRRLRPDEDVVEDRLVVEERIELKRSDETMPRYAMGRPSSDVEAGVVDPA